MALYALHLEQVISADDAPVRGKYTCLECKGPMQVRQGRKRRHFYHVKMSPSCRLYSKSEDHLILQLQIQSLFPQKEIFLEKPFSSIGRLADACWDRCKIVFEIQCSLITETEAHSRIEDYGSLGYHVVWLLDDRVFNRRVLRPAEPFLRKNTCYYIGYQKEKLSCFYDQFELIAENRRLRRGSRASVNLFAPRNIPKSPPSGIIPEQILNRRASWLLFFHGDLFHKALLSSQVRPLAAAMQNWVFLEREAKNQKKSFAIAPKWIRPLFWRFFHWLLGRIDS